MVCIIIVCKWYLIPIPKPKLQNLFEGTNVHTVHQDFARFLTLLETSLARFEFHRTCITVVQPNSSRFRPLFLAWLLYDVCTKPSRSHGSFGVANANPCIKAWDYIYIYIYKSLGLSASHFGVRITLRLPISCVQFFFAFWYIQASIQKTAPHHLNHRMESTRKSQNTPEQS